MNPIQKNPPRKKKRKGETRRKNRQKFILRETNHRSIRTSVHKLCGGCFNEDFTVSGQCYWTSIGRGNQPCRVELRCRGSILNSWRKPRLLRRLEASRGLHSVALRRSRVRNPESCGILLGKPYQSVCTHTQRAERALTPALPTPERLFHEHATPMVQRFHRNFPSWQ